MGNVMDPAVAFKSLKTSKERNQALAFIVSELSPYEWRRLQDRLQQRTFQFDILTSLPMELVILVLRHLEPEEVFLLRRVSKTWQRVLSSQEICSSVLQYHFLEIGAPDYPLDNHSAILLKGTRRWHAFKAGRAFGSATYKHNSTDHSSADGRHRAKVAYHARKLAWIEQDPQTGAHNIIVRFLDSQRILHGNPTNREKLSSVAIGKTLVAAVSLMGDHFIRRVHVWDLSDAKQHHFRLPSAAFEDINIKGRTVGLLFLSSVLLWDFNSQSLHEVKLDHAYRNRNLLLLHPTEDSIVIFSRSYENIAICLRRIGFERYSYSGVLLSSGTIQTCFYGIGFDCLWCIQPCDYQGLYSIRTGIGTSIASYSASSDPTKYVQGVQFDSRTNQLLKIELPGYYDCLLWKGISYTLNIRRDRENTRHDGETKIFVTNLNNLKHLPAAKEAEFSQLWSIIMEHERPHSSRQGLLLGDDSFLIRSCGGGLDVWRFAEDCTMLEENEDFRTQVIAKTGRKSQGGFGSVVPTGDTYNQS